MAARLALLTCFYALVSRATAQSPGPDWPQCVSTSLQYHPGWEVLDLGYWPPEERSWVAAVTVDLQNVADGSRTVCHLERDVTKEEAQDPVVLDNSDGECVTVWTEKYNYEPEDVETKAETAQIKFDVSTGVLTVEQEWNCRNDNGEVIPFVGTASQGYDYKCAAGREGEPTTCTPSTTFLIGTAPLFVGPASVRLPSSPADSASPGRPSENCAAAAFSFPGWQILSMNYNPPAPQPEGSPYAPVSTRIELRNLADGSRTLCYLESQDISSADRGITLQNEGVRLGDGNFENGCLTGWFDIQEGEGGKIVQEWEWQQTANVTFNTKTYELSIEQEWACGGMEHALEAFAAEELDMECQDTGNSMVPLACNPATALFSTTSAPVVIGAARLPFRFGTS